MLDLMRRATLIGAAGVLAIACGGGAVPTLPPGVSIPPIDVPSVGLPNGSQLPDQALEGLFPDDIAGNALTIRSARGEAVRDVFGGDEPEQLNQFLSSLGVGLDQISAAVSFDVWPGATANEFTSLSISAFQARGVPGATTAQSLLGFASSEIEDAEVSQTTVAGKSVTAIEDPEHPDRTVYLYTFGDVVFMVAGSPQHVEEALTKLP